MVPPPLRVSLLTLRNTIQCLLSLSLQSARFGDATRVPFTVNVTLDLHRATEGDELQQVVPALGDEHDGRLCRGARRFPCLFQSLRVIVPSIATGTVMVETEHALRRWRRQRPAPGSGGGFAGTRAAQVARAVRRGVVARACNLENAG